jgi:hypothetical protein
MVDGDLPEAVKPGTEVDHCNAIDIILALLRG